MKKLLLTIILLAIMLCGCDEEKLQCDCCQTYKAESEVEYYSDDDMSICKDCAKYALSNCNYCHEDFVINNNEYNSTQYCMGCIYDGNIGFCGNCGTVNETYDMYFDEYCGNCIVRSKSLEICDSCGEVNFSHGTVYTSSGNYCVECHIASQEDN